MEKKATTSNIVEIKAKEVGRDWVDDKNYYDNADSWVEAFWAPSTPFRQLFDQIDPNVCVDLACGRGRHTWQIRDLKNKNILVDIVPENIEFCINRFSNYGNMTFIVNNGFDLSDIASSSVSGLFCYDAMVHFDHTVVFSYLSEIYRILQSGGKAVLHHSNYGSNPGGDYRSNPSWRNFMPPGLFADYAKKSNLAIVEQRIIPWGKQNASIVSVYYRNQCKRCC